MNKKVLAVVAVVVVVLLAGGTYMMISKNNKHGTSNSSSTSSSSQTEQANIEQAESGNIFSIADAGKAKKCTYTYTSSSGEGTGTMYSDGKGRAFMTVDIKTEKDNTGKTSTLLLSDKVYGWTETKGKTIGFIYDKSKFTSGSSSNTSATGPNNVDPNKQFKLSCSGWNVDESVLTVPQDVNFTSLPATVPGQ